jgi:ABC-type ATPase with predicted acetyltransferase domain
VPHFDIIKQSTPSDSFRVAKIKGLFDLQNDHNEEHFTGDITLPEKWNIGVIVGPSGTGKTTIAKELFGEDYFTEPEFKSASVIDDMPEADANVIAMTFNSVGFSSPPSWLKPYEVLSNGEKMRVQLAYSILQNKDQIVFDEYTSVVDRNVAQIGSAAISKAIKRLDKKFVAVACHYDILDWLEPDWVFDTAQMQMVNQSFLGQPFSLISSSKKDSGLYLESIII